MCPNCHKRWTTYEHIEYGEGEAKVSISVEALRRLRAAAVMLDNIQITIAAGVQHPSEPRYTLNSIKHGKGSQDLVSASAAGGKTGEG